MVPLSFVPFNFVCFVISISTPDHKIRQDQSISNHKSKILRLHDDCTTLSGPDLGCGAAYRGWDAVCSAVARLEAKIGGGSGRNRRVICLVHDPDIGPVCRQHAIPQAADLLIARE